VSSEQSNEAVSERAARFGTTWSVGMWTCMLEKLIRWNISE